MNKRMGAFRVAGVAESCMATLLIMTLLGCSTSTREDTQAIDKVKQLTDPYLWLEDIDSDRSLNWVRQQNEASLAALKSHPDYDAMYAQAHDVYTSSERLLIGQPRNGYLYNYWQDTENPQGIWRRTPLKSYLGGSPEWDVLFDLDAFNRAESAEDGINWVWHGVSCLADSDKCLLSLSHGGLDADVVREYDLATRQFVDDGFNLPEAKQEVEWLDEDTLLLTRPRGDGSVTSSGYPRTASLWVRETPFAESKVMLEIDTAETGVFVQRFEGSDGRQLTLVRARSFFEQESYHVSSDGVLTRLPAPLLSELKGFHDGQALIALTEPWSITTKAGEQSFPSGSLISYSLGEVRAGEPLSRVHTVYAPDAKSALQNVETTAQAVYIAASENVASKVYRATFATEGWSLSPVELPEHGSIQIRGVSSESDQLFYQFENFLNPDSLYYQEDGGIPREIASLPRWFNDDNLVIAQREAISADGTAIPYYLVHPADIELNGSTPTLLYGYGGFQAAMQPFYSGGIGRLWLERGGAYALANIRGGGEFGPAWHQAALKENRQRSFDDFIAVAEHLTTSGVTSPRHLGIQGGSNGGLLVGAVMVQRPDLFNAVVCQVPLLDMLRYHHLLAGASWIGEYGDPDIPEQHAYLARYSPYQALTPEATYPRAYIYTSTRDDRVHPAHARKFVARLKEQGHDVYYYERIEGGHSGGANLAQAAESVALQYAYLWSQLGSSESAQSSKQSSK